MLCPDSFLTHTLRHHPRGAAVTRILSAAIQAVDPGIAVRSHLVRDGDELTVAGRRYNLQNFRRVYMIGLGKASLAMVNAAASILGDLSLKGLVITKHITHPLPAGMEVLEGAHPIPDERSVIAGQKATRFLEGTRADDLVICLISGGGSALVTVPEYGITLTEMQSLTSALLACGARIDEINTLRRHLDRIKGGGIPRFASRARMISLILSDVVGDPLESIASGPTAPDPSTRQDAIDILNKYNLQRIIPPSILDALHTSPETPKPGDGLFNQVQNVIIGSNPLAAQAALGQACREGCNGFLLRTDLQGEARSVALELSNILRQAHQAHKPVSRPACIVVGGETTVTIRGNGLGGRNQELVLAAVPELTGIADGLLVSLATDGEDGKTDAAGAVADGETLARAFRLGLDPLDFLERNDSYHFFHKLGDLLQPGPTGTNVNDLVFLFLF